MKFNHAAGKVGSSAQLLYRIQKLILPAAVLILGCSRAPRLDSPPPNILLIVMDAARADHFSCYGYHRATTPNIDRVAAEGLRFTQAVSSSSWTLPSHASLFTGLLPCEHETHAQHTWLIDRIPTLAELLKYHGYRTASFSNNPWIDATKNITRGFDISEAIWADTSVVTSEKLHNTEHTNELVRRFLEKSDSKTGPFFVFINYMDVHNPYDPPEPYRSLFLSKDQLVSARIDSVNRDPKLVNKGLLKLSDQDYQTLCDIYDGAFVYLDSKIEELLDYLRGRGLYENTLVIITSDHGEVFGEYGLFTHGALLYRPLVQIPLIIHHRRLTGPAAVRHAPVSITDIFHTIVRLLKIEDSAAPTGAPVSYLLDPGIDNKLCYSELKVDRMGEKSGLGSEKYDLRALWTAESRHYIISGNVSYECYDLTVDSAERNNLYPRQVSKEQIVSEVTAFEARLNVLIEVPQDLRITREIQVDPQHERAMRALGYVGGNEIDQIMPAMEEHPHVMEHLKTGIFLFRYDSLDAAEQEMRTVIKMSPNNVIARKYLGGILYNQGNYEEAMRMLRSILGKTDMDTKIRLLLAGCLFNLKRLDEALELFRRISDENPDEPNSAVSVVRILLKNKDYGGAEVYLRRAVENNPDNLEVLRMVIGGYLVYGNLARARELLRVEIEKEPTINAYLVLADVCKNMGLIEEARGYWEKSLTMDLPPNLRAMVRQTLKKL